MTNKILLAAGLTNVIGILVFSKLFNNKNLYDFDSLFDNRGNILILLWGLTYIFTKNPHKNPLMLVFFLEKMVYVYNYYKSINKDIDKIKLFWEKDKITYLFLMLYGIIDLIFGLLFLYLFFLK